MIKTEKILILLVLASILLPGKKAYAVGLDGASSDLSFVVDGVDVTSQLPKDQLPLLSKDGVTFVSLRSLEIILPEIEVSYDEDTKSVSALRDDGLGNKIGGYVKPDVWWGHISNMDGPELVLKEYNFYDSNVPRIHNNRAYVPLRFIIDSLGLNIKWNDQIKSITINTDTKKTEDKPELDNFNDLTSSFIAYNFSKKEVDNFHEIKGRYDLNGDGVEDQIDIRLKKSGDKGSGSYIKINGLKKDIFIDDGYRGEVRLLDIDKNDNFIEVAVFDDGPSADPIYVIYRYDGEEIHELGSLDDKAVIDNSGRAIPSLWISHFEPKFYSGWLEIENNEFVFISNEMNTYLGKKYSFSDNTIGFFTFMEETPELFVPDWKLKREFSQEEFTLVDFVGMTDYKNPNLHSYFVELANGKKGIMYFWIGD